MQVWPIDGVRSIRSGAHGCRRLAGGGSRLGASAQAGGVAVGRCHGGAPVAFVGKGITFDTGGISIKPADGHVGDAGRHGGGGRVRRCHAGAGSARVLRVRPIAVLALAENAVGSCELPARRRAADAVGA